jgi:glyoxylase-like metal-dependent hydrolase (beta-lactamase superfamily II)
VTHVPTSRQSIHSFLRLLLAALACFFACLSFAGAPQQKTQVPGYYRFMVGSFEVTALYDGYIDLDSALLRNTNPKEVQGLLARMFLKGPKVQTAVNAYLVNTGDQLVLVDAGAAKGFGPTLGYIGDNLKAAGYDAAKIDAVLITHLHGDHVNGLLAADGTMAFPNAEVWSAQPDNDFWLSLEVAGKAPEGFQPFFKMARDAAAPYQQAGRWKTFSNDQDIFPGIASVAARGHTPGHSAYQLSSGQQQLLIWGDLVHNHAVQFARPHVAIEFDIDKKQAVLARKALFARAAKEKLLVGGMHLPFPGVGHVRSEGKGYVWVPVEFGPIRE